MTAIAGYGPEGEGDDGFRDARVPTCVNAFDNIVKGGLPTGSLVLLLGEVGAGHLEFAYTSAARLSLAKKDRRVRERYVKESFGHPIVIPPKTLYISITRSREDVLREVRLSFDRPYYEAFKSNLVFKDLSSIYFKHTPVPSSWVTDTPVPFLSSDDGTSLVESLVAALEADAPQNLVIIDSLTDLFISSMMDEKDLLFVLKGLQRASKKWESLVYLLLTTEVLDPARERMIADLADGVLVFGWQRTTRQTRMRRYMYVSKFMGVLPHLDQQRVSRFFTEIRHNTGFVVANTERI
ncbi:MAG: recombinase RecA [Thermoplasmata archaeon]|nr:recombinase RecA [Thermoplasmata archaeon]